MRRLSDKLDALTEEKLIAHYHEGRYDSVNEWRSDSTRKHRTDIGIDPDGYIRQERRLKLERQNRKSVIGDTRYLNHYEIGMRRLSY
jgi:hypothetical protein